MSRYAIRNPAGLLYTDNTVPETVYVPRADNPRIAEPRSILIPVFGASSATQALKYANVADASAMLNYPDLQDPQAFAGCELFECEFDPSDMGAVRAVPV